MKSITRTYYHEEDLDFSGVIEDLLIDSEIPLGKRFKLTITPLR